jgi:hypothetical protein
MKKKGVGRRVSLLGVGRRVSLLCVGVALSHNVCIQACLLPNIKETIKEPHL